MLIVGFIFICCLSINDYWIRWWSFIMNSVDKYAPVKPIFRSSKPRCRLPGHNCNVLYRRNHAWLVYK